MAARWTALPFTPTKNRRLNEFVGLVLLVSAVLLLLALVSYRPTDASFNTVSGVAGKHLVHNWAGVIGANTSDILLQVEGAAALLLPVLLGILGWSWLRSRATASPWGQGHRRSALRRLRSRLLRIAARKSSLDERGSTRRPHGSTPGRLPGRLPQLPRDLCHRHQRLGRVALPDHGLQSGQTPAPGWPSASRTGTPCAIDTPTGR